MSGVRVCKISNVDWIQQREKPILTVPGSYWLCYKNNIYKFIFRYHRPHRNTQEEFSFGKDLMKIIRKIIKCKPCQGQQFGTRHLLVTYNHTSWTRQDKMFAMLKFKERTNAATFSHAFVLTIKVSLVESVKTTVEHPMTTRYSTQSLNLQSKDSDTNWRTRITNKKPMGQTLNSADASYSKSKSNLLSEQSARIVTISDEVDERKSLADNVTRTRTRDGKFAAENKDSPLTFNIVGDTLVDKSSTRSKSPKVKDTVEQEWPESDSGHDELPNTVKEPFEIDITDTLDAFADDNSFSHDNFNNSSSSNSTFDDAALDSANLPYQYLIEKEIENAKNKALNARNASKKTPSHNNSVDQQHSKKRKLNDANRKDEKPSINSVETSDTTKSDDPPSPKRKKYVSDNKTSRSSNITDLVMEGLMFTIRQGQDSVTVIEQKAKLEMDEVLENSEKVETKEGEKGLRNSSLLRLENLVTMIEVPKQTEIEQNQDSSTSTENDLQFRPIVNNKPLFSTTRENCIYGNKSNGEHKDGGEFQDTLRWQSSYYDNVFASTSFPSDKKYLHIRDRGKYSEMDKHLGGEESTDDKMDEGEEEEEDEEDEEEEEEDIIPEALQNKIFGDSRFFFKNTTMIEELKSVGSVTKMDISTNDTNVETDSDIKSKAHNSVNCHTDATSEMKTSNRERQGVNFPRIVSNQTITMEQIPLRLQQVLRQKLIEPPVPLSNENNTCKTNPEVHELHSWHKKDKEENVELENQLHSPITNNDTLETIQSVEKLNEYTDSDKLTNVKNISLVESETELWNDDALGDKKLKDEIKAEGISESKMESPIENELHDVTQAFYDELSQLEKTNNSTHQRVLRQKGKSLNTCSDVKNSESRVEMLKLIQDITRGAKVVVKRMSTKSIHSIMGKSSSLATCMH